ncbi:MAG: type I methionyl aminopeptidase [Firmicutes bacterium]|nr:type I methionyl aminopeptidase [Bacillota bacterium]MCL1954195.1 type I methionyl aminopeptidase [Bacillota bacterium]
MIFIKTDTEIANMRQAGKVVGEALNHIKQFVDVGVATLELDKIMQDFVLTRGCIPSFVGYQGYKYTTCMSVNSAVVHGIPNNYKLQLGDIVGIDIAVSFNGCHADAARTYGVVKISGLNQKLISTTEECFFEGIKFAKPEYRVGDIGHAIQRLAESKGYGVVRDLTGHGIGKSLHEAPSVPNYGKSGSGASLKKGMAIAVEPMINQGTERVTIDKLDNWTCRTLDGSNSAHYENTILITDSEPEIITLV